MICILFMLLMAGHVGLAKDFDLSSPHHLLAHLSVLMKNVTAIGILPHIEQTSTDNTYSAGEGDEVKLPCTVRNQGNNTVLWTKSHPGGDNVLTVNRVRVTPDMRVNLIHNAGGEVYILTISNLTIADSGLYSCELNTQPPLRSFHKLQVEKGSHPVLDPDASSLDCCLARNVSRACLGFCSVTNIMAGKTKVNPGNCESSFPTIVSCLADDRDHLPCCLEAGLPQYCRDMCRGQYNKVTDQLKTQFDCGPHLQPTLQCIAEGIRSLPSRPQELAVVPVNSTAIELQWRSAPQPDGTNYKINVTLVKQLEKVASTKLPKVVKIAKVDTTIHSIEASPAPAVSLTIGGLKVFGLYEVTLWAENSAGKSLTTYRVRVATNFKETSKLDKLKKSDPFPQLPDTEACCAAKNVSYRPCRQKFCNPLNLKQVTQDDLLKCSTWETEIFSCLADGKDHTSCCSQRNVPSICNKMCSGTLEPTLPTDILCLPYMTELSSCLLQGYGVLPSSPLAVSYSNVHSTWGVLHWDTPAILGDSVEDYVVSWQAVGLSKQMFAHNTQSPYIIEGLQPNTSYQVFVEAQNSFGKGESSARIYFRTPAAQSESHKEKYNHGDCCVTAKMRPACRPLCSYNLTLSTVERSMMNPSKPDYQVNNFRALSWTEGLLGPANKGGEVLLTWDKPNKTADPVKMFQVFYKLYNGSQEPSTLFDNTSVYNTSAAFLKIPRLEVKKVYQFFVVATNSAGTSLPSSLVTVNVSRDAWEGVEVAGSPSPPHQLTALRVAVDSIQLSWQTPTISNHEWPLHYNIFYRLAGRNSSEPRKLSTELTNVRLSQLPAATQYVIYATAVAKMRDGSELESRRSEEVLVWTLEAVPANVEVRVVKANSRSPGLGPLLGALFHGFNSFRQRPVTEANEGSTVTVLCLAQGSPTPRLALYMGGEKVSSQKTHYMAVIVQNITRQTSELTCIADNNYGAPSEATTTLAIHFKPEISLWLGNVATGALKSSPGSSVTVRCLVKASPPPQVALYRGSENTFIGSMSRQASKVENNTSVFFFTIANLTLNDTNEYSCIANNSLGVDSASMTINVTLPRTFTNVTSCCRRVGISSDCLSLCSQDIDLDWFAVTSKCLSQFSKVMSCASDGSDHRHCCQEKGLPREALDWCRGSGGTDTVVLALAFSRVIQGCFHEGRDKLPGPPANLKVKISGPSQAIVFWKQPIKNPESVQLYRVYWRPLSEESVKKVNSFQRSLHLNGLVIGSSYEVAVKAANGKGTSQLTEPLIFKFTGSAFISTMQNTTSKPTSISKISSIESKQSLPELLHPTGEPKSVSSEERTYIITTSFALVTLLGIVLFLLERRRRSMSPNRYRSDSPSVAFGNPLDESGVLRQEGEVEIRTPSPRMEEKSSPQMENPLEIETPPVPSNLSRVASAIHSIISFPRAGAGRGFIRFQ